MLDMIIIDLVHLLTSTCSHGTFYQSVCNFLKFNISCLFILGNIVTFSSFIFLITGLSKGVSFLPPPRAQEGEKKKKKKTAVNVLLMSFYCPTY